MTLVVVEFGAQELSPVSQAFGTLLSDVTLRLEALPVSKQAEMNYDQFRGSLSDAFSKLASDELSSVRLFGPTDSTLLGSVYCPRFSNEPPNLWLGWAEGVQRPWAQVLDELLAVEGLQFVAVTVEETIDHCCDQVTADNFPWKHWRLLAAAVRDEVSGAWIREAPTDP